MPRQKGYQAVTGRANESEVAEFVYSMVFRHLHWENMAALKLKLFCGAILLYSPFMRAVIRRFQAHCIWWQEFASVE
jgi:hypothetical protein